MLRFIISQFVVASGYFYEENATDHGTDHKYRLCVCVSVCAQIKSVEIS